MHKRVCIKGQAWKTMPWVCVAVSVGKEAHEGEKLQALLAWVEKTQKPCVFRVSDTLQRHNLIADGMGEEEAFLEASLRGDAWLQRNYEALSSLSNPPKIVRWNELLFSPDFEEVHRGFRERSYQDPVLREAVEEDIDMFCSRRSLEDPDKMDLLRTCSRNFLLEEMAGHTILARRYLYANLYPSSGLKSLRLIRDQAIMGVPLGLEKTCYVRYSFENRHDVLPVQEKQGEGAVRKVA